MSSNILPIQSSEEFWMGWQPYGGGYGIVSLLPLETFSSLNVAAVLYHVLWKHDWRKPLWHRKTFWRYNAEKRPIGNESKETFTASWSAINHNGLNLVSTGGCVRLATASLPSSAKPRPASSCSGLPFAAFTIGSFTLSCSLLWLQGYCLCSWCFCNASHCHFFGPELAPILQQMDPV